MGGAVGAGFALIVLPCVALYLVVQLSSDLFTMTLPILAIFGIMILFGTVAIVSTLFSRLNLSDTKQPLALPEGSIRAVIALSLIVLFAIISIMLYQSDSKPYVIHDVSNQTITEIMKIPSNHVVAVQPESCAKPANSSQPKASEGKTPMSSGSVEAKPNDDARGASAIKTDSGSNNTSNSKEICGPLDQRFAVHIRLSQAQESIDLAKQLLILIGTLMTSVTSFYFASRTVEAIQKDKPKEQTTLPTTNSVLAGPENTQNATQVDGCDVAIVNATADEDLPAARGGVA